MSKNKKKNKKAKVAHYHFESAKIIDVKKLKKAVRKARNKKEV